MVQTRACRCEEDFIYQIDIPLTSKLYLGCCCCNSYIQYSEPYNCKQQCECCCLWSSDKCGFKRFKKFCKFHIETPICPCLGIINLMSIPCYNDNDVPCTCTLLPCCLIYPKCCKCLPKYYMIEEAIEEKERKRIEKVINKINNNDNIDNDDKIKNINKIKNLNNYNNNNKDKEEKAYYPGSPIISELQIIGQKYKACRCNKDGTDDLKYDTDIPNESILCYGDCCQSCYYQQEEPCRCRGTEECCCFWRNSECGWKNPTKFIKCHAEYPCLPFIGCIGCIQVCSYPNCWDDDVDCLISLLPFTISYPRCIILPSFSVQKIGFEHYNEDDDDDDFDLHQNKPRVMKNRNNNDNNNNNNNSEGKTA